MYHGEIKEDSKPFDEVDFINGVEIGVNDMSMIDGDEVCGYTIYKSYSDLPFEVSMNEVRSKDGRAKIIVAPGRALNYEKRHRYTFDIAAHDCFQSKHTERQRVHIEVLDVNEFAPTWSQQVYDVTVRDGVAYKNITQLTAIDEDGSEDFASICSYELLTPYVPFNISNTGVIQNTEPLSWEHEHNYILRVRAEDCGGKQGHALKSEPVSVNIEVQEPCRSGWKGFDERIEYLADSSVLRLAEDADLELCDEQCQTTEVSTTLRLQTKHIGKGCDRDTYSIQSQRKLCGASSGSVDLLPSTHLGLWSEKVPNDDGSDQIFSFDGHTNAVEVPSERLNHSLAEHFTISMWMRHEDNSRDLGQHYKEHILCNADEYKLSRHHFSLFVHNCKLVLLVRQEPVDGVDLNHFKPAEWRWKLTQVCDNEWHHYAVNVDFPKVRLFVDGQLFMEDNRNPDIIDDWPLHPTKIQSTRLVVGACWHGGDHQLTEYFEGFLSDVSILSGKTESARVIMCLNNCKEQLDFHAMSQMDPGMSVAFNSEMTEITIKGKNTSEIEKLVRRIGYVNSRRFPTPGRRDLTIDTSVTCANGRALEISPLTSTVVVMEMEHQQTTLSATPNLARDEHSVKLGVHVFADLTVLTGAPKRQEENLNSAQKVNEYNLDSCTVTVVPAMNPEMEEIRYPANQLKQRKQDVYNTADGISITGTDTVSQYETVLRQLQYAHHDSVALASKTFKLRCSELNGRFTSNEIQVTLNVLHPVEEPVEPHHVMESSNNIHTNVLDMKQNNVQNLRRVSGDKNPFNAQAATGTGVGMIVIIVVCVGFLLFMIVLGVIRIRSSHQRSQDACSMEEKQEMEWDNSALTITVNPMDQPGIYEGEAEMTGLRDDSDSDDDDGSSYHDEVESSEEEPEKPQVKERDLEWDESALTF